MNSARHAHDLADWPRMTVSLLLATLLALAPWGQSPAIPDVLALVLAWWALHRPQRGLLAAGFVLGVLMDGHTAATLGEHALLYTVIVWMTLQFQRRIAWFRLGGQMLHMLGIFLVAQGALTTARFLLGLPFLGPEQFLPWLGTALLWPLADLLLPARHAGRRAASGAGPHGPRTAPFVDPERVVGDEAGMDAPAGVPIYAHADEPATTRDGHTSTAQQPTMPAFHGLTPVQPASFPAHQPTAAAATPGTAAAGQHYWDNGPTWIDPEVLMTQGATPPHGTPSTAPRATDTRHAPSDGLHAGTPGDTQVAPHAAPARRPAYWHYQPDDHGH